MLQILVVVLAAGLALVLLRYHMLRREVGRIADVMGEIHSQPTNRQLTIGTQQCEVARLAVAVNTLYNDMDAAQAAHRTALDEVRQSTVNISHDLRTPLTSVLGYLKLLKSDKNTPEQKAHYLDVAYQKANALNGLVGGLFELARLESGGYTFAHQRLDAAALLAEELAGAYSQMEAIGIQPEVCLPEGPVWILGDAAALSRVFANLLQNMVKHGQAPMRITGGAKEGEAVFHFANGASGLAPGDVEQFFQRFFTGDRMRSGKDTGLGLAIVKEFVEQMNGSVSAALQDGTLTFTLRWPLAAQAIG